MSDNLIISCSHAGAWERDISFDGYGCCYPDTEMGIGTIPFEESALLISIIENGSFHESKASEILSRYFKESEATLWGDALKEHELISA